MQAFHFDLTINLGQLLMIATLFGIIWRIEIFTKWLLFEHEMLIDWYCKQNNIKKSDLLSRQSSVLTILLGRKNG